MKLQEFNLHHNISRNISNVKLAVRAVVAVAVLVMSMAMASPVAAQINAEQVLNIGRNVLSMDDYMLSIQYFNQAIKAKPYLADPYFFRALAKLNLEDYKGAEEDCTLAIERNKYKTEAYKLRGFARQYLGKDSLAVEDYNVGLDYNPIDKYFLYYKAVAQTSMKKFEAGDSAFATLLRHFPKFDDGYTARAHLNVQRGDTAAALDDLGKAISISSSTVNPYLLRAEILSKRHEWESALADMDAAIRLRPDDGDFYLNRAFLRYNADDFFGAMADYNYTLELEPYNAAAIFNRALLRYEVRDLTRAEEDFSRVLKLDPSNFHALFNRGLVRLEQGKNKEANQDFSGIIRKYPRFYPAYYARAEAMKNMGDLRGAVQQVKLAEEMVKGYVKNPDANPLDRPKIASAMANTSGSHADPDNQTESDEEVMSRFNQLVTVEASVASTPMSYNERIKGRVQDRDVLVAPEPMYSLSFTDAGASLKSESNYFRELDALNHQSLIPQKLYLVQADGGNADQGRIDRLFSLAEYYGRIAEDLPRPVDMLALGVAQMELKNYPAAIAALDRAIKGSPDNSIAYMARGYARYADSEAKKRGAGDAADTDAKESGEFRLRTAAKAAEDVIADYDKALSINPRLVYAWFNKGNIYYSLGDYTSALQCYSEAITINPAFGEAYYNRGLAYLQTGNKRQAFVDLSKAGELGVIPSYNLLKRMK